MAVILSIKLPPTVEHWAVCLEVCQDKESHGPSPQRTYHLENAFSMGKKPSILQWFVALPYINRYTGYLWFKISQGMGVLV